MHILNPIMRQKAGKILSKPWFFPLLICFLVNVIGILFTFHSELAPVEVQYLVVSLAKHNAIMTVVGTSLMTLIGVSFSISMLILSTLSNQYSPRLLPNVLHSRITQVTLGLFLATFLFTLFCLYLDSSLYTRAIQSIYVLILAILCLVVLILFVNYVINSIQIDYILDDVQLKTKKSIKKNYVLDKDISYPENTLHPSERPSHLISIKKSGYVQGIDYTYIKQLAQKYNCLVELKIRPGDYILYEHHIITLFQLEDTKESQAIDNLFRESIQIGQNRELTQDIEFGFEQIAEVAVRALSPGINDPYTARHCLWILADLFTYVESYQLEIYDLYDGAKWIGRYRGFSYQGLVHASMDRIRQAAKEDFTVMLAMYDVIIRLISLLKKRQLIRPLMKQAKSISEMQRDLSLTYRDKMAIDERHKSLDDIARRFELDWWF